MASPLSDEDAGRQVLDVFARNKIPPSGVLRRNNFFDVRDGDFQRGIDRAVFNKWIVRLARDRYRYSLPESGYVAGRMSLPVETAQG